MHEVSATRAEVLLPLFVAVARVADWNATWASCDARSAVATDAEEGSRAMLLGLGVVVFAQVSCHTHACLGRLLPRLTPRDAQGVRLGGKKLAG